MWSRKSQVTSQGPLKRPHISATDRFGCSRNPPEGAHWVGTSVTTKTTPPVTLSKVTCGKRGLNETPEGEVVTPPIETFTVNNERCHRPSENLFLYDPIH